MGFTRQETSKFIKAGPIRMHYNEAGSGDPLICVHGGGRAPPDGAIFPAISTNSRSTIAPFSLIFRGLAKPKG